MLRQVNKSITEKVMSDYLIKIYYVDYAIRE